MKKYGCQIFFVLWFLCAVVPAKAQAGFDTLLNYQQVQDLMNQRDPRQQALAWYHWAYYTERQYGDTDSAFQYLARSVQRFRRIDDTLAYQRARSDLADWMAKRKLVDEAIKMQEEALFYARTSGQIRLQTLVLARLSRYYLSLSDNANALKYRRLFRESNLILKDTSLEVTVLLEEVLRLKKEGRISEAKTLSARTVELARRLPHKELLTQAFYNSGAIAAYDRDYDTALRFLKKAEAIPMGPLDNQRRLIYKELSVTYAALDSLHSAYYYAYKYADLADSILLVNRDTAAQRIVMQFDTREKSKAIEILKKEKQSALSQAQEQRLFIAALAVGLGALILAMFFIVRDYRHRLHTTRVINQQKEEINARKIRELEDALKIETMQSMLEGQESERQRIAHDLHDSLGGLLAAARLQLESLSGKVPQLQDDKDLLKIKDLLDETIDEPRQIARNLQPGTLLQFGLVKAIQDLINRVQSKGGPEISFQHFGSYTDLSQHFALNCYRIVQELLQNCMKHAKSKEILVQLTRTDQQIALIVEDDGVGFNQETVLKGMGTGNIAQRVQFLKGEMSIQTAPGKGTSTLITVALPPAQGKP